MRHLLPYEFAAAVVAAIARGSRGGRASAMRKRGFSMVELMVAATLTVILTGILASLINQSATVWQRTQKDASAYQSAIFAFDLMTRTLSQSRMNVYEDYDNPTQPTAYLRKSDLRFVITAPPVTAFGQGNAVFFQAPACYTQDSANLSGLPGLLNSVGYYVTYGKNPNLPSFLNDQDRPRFRLMQFLAPSEGMTASLGSASSDAWYKDNLAKYSTVIADNVICVLFWPRVSREEDAEGDDLTLIKGGAYLYDSRFQATTLPQPVTANQQPPLVQMTLVAIDKASLARFPDAPTPPTEITGALQGLFTKATETQFRADLKVLETKLIAARVGYRIFTTTVTLRESKWNP